MSLTLGGWVFLAAQRTLAEVTRLRGVFALVESYPQLKAPRVSFDR